MEGSQRKLWDGYCLWTVHPTGLLGAVCGVEVQRSRIIPKPPLSRELDRCQSRQVISWPITLLFKAKNTSKELALLASSPVLLALAPESPKRGLFKDQIRFFSWCREILATSYSFHLLRLKKTPCYTHSMLFFSTNNTRNFTAQKLP